MGTWADIEVWRRRRAELIREAQERALAREARKIREAFAVAEERPAGVPLGMEVRWGLAEDEPAVADLLQLNGMPRWVAFEERFVVAEKDGKIVGAVRYVTESKRLSLGLLVADPWTDERRTAAALYRGAVVLAEDLGASDVLATTARGAAYPGEAGYHRVGRVWRSPVPPEGGGGRVGFWRTLLHLLGTRAALPFYRVPR